MILKPDSTITNRTRVSKMINSYSEALKRLQELQAFEDYERSHPEADEILMECLKLSVIQSWTIEQSYKIAEAYDEVGKWYG